MLFNSIGFIFFFIIVFCTYWLLHKHLRLQNIFLLIAGYFFYSMWDYRFTFLLLFSTLLDFFSGLMITKHPHRKKFWLILSVVVNLVFLGLFKYYNFFIESFADFVGMFGLRPDMYLMKIILPVGISFYTFHGLSYVFDIYRNRIPVERNLVDYALFVNFFPLLVAGPIERASHLLPQVKQPRIFHYEYAANGMRQLLWGYFKKLVIADNLSVYVNEIFHHHQQYSGFILMLGALLFAIQIYCDFSGYTDIALGCGKLMGFELLRNFSYPYFAHNIPEFWRRWHISLSSWFRDYLYIPMGGSRVGKARAIVNTFTVFLVSGFWHGASWKFLFWGLLHALYMVPSLLKSKEHVHIDVAHTSVFFPSFKFFGQMVLTFALVCFAWIFFRANSIHEAFAYVGGLVRLDGSNSVNAAGTVQLKVLLMIVSVFMVVEWWGRSGAYAIYGVKSVSNKLVRWLIYFFIVFLILMFMHTEESPFIYFQF